MTIPLDSANVYTDFQGLDELRLSADKRDPKAMEAAAKQFEALFIQQMLKSVRDASVADGMFDSEQSRFYLDMFDKQISLSMTQGEGIGLAKMIVHQLQLTAKKVDEISHTSPVSAIPIADSKFNTRLNQHDTAVVDRAQANQTQTSQVKTNQEMKRIEIPLESDTNPAVAGESGASIQAYSNYTDNTDHHEFSSAADFVQKLWPHAQRVAKTLGVDPKVLIAQSALETGWGKYVTRHADGRSSNNYFNIKADQRWQGETISLATLEFSDGIPVPEKASFRSYSSVEDSFNDYAEFIQSSSRYHQALRQASDLEKYTQELQDAGYATDPEYSSKIMNIINGTPLNEALENVKLSMSETITPMSGSQK